MVKQKFGKYKIVQWLGGGSFGDVFLAKDTLINKQFALKVARLREADVRMLEEEAKLLASLEHPAIVRFYNIDIIEGRLSLAMEYVPGENLRQIINRVRCLEFDKAINIIAKVAEGIEYAHKRSVIHRDLKPENIIISDLGQPKITDFGLGRFIKPGSLSVSTAGTPVYMAPEAWSGKYSFKTDIWGIGAILYETLTGTPPFMADNLDELKKKINRGKITPVKKLPDRIQKLIGDCLIPVPEKRPDAEYFCSELRSGSGIEIEDRVSIFIPSTEDIQLTKTQREAIDWEGPVLLLGSVGTGKTTTLTYAIAERIKQGCDPKRLLVFTFTNRSANDIRERLQRLIKHELKDLWLGTIHYICTRILRRDISRLDYPEDFEITAPVHQLKVLKSWGLGTNQAKGILNQIGLLKAKGLNPEDLTGRDKWGKKLKGVYRRYQDFLKQNNLVDYDDLISLTVRLLEQYDDLKRYYQDLFDWIFLDELQDITPIQYRLVKLLTRDNLFITGDEDQSIYSWRGAKPELIYQVMKEIKGIRTFLLTRSFRVPERIGQLAMGLKSGSSGLLPKDVAGQVTIYSADNEKDEAKYIANQIRKLARKGYNFIDIAILYRTNAQSRLIEEALFRNNIPYQIIGSERFYEREKVKLLVSYLKSIADKKKDDAFILLRKMGRSRIPKAARELVVNQINDEPRLTPYAILDGIKSSSKSLTKALGHEEAVEFLEFARSFGPGRSKELVEQVALLENLDLVDWGKNTVRFMTIHSAKGLEFKVVFLAGINEGILPSMKGTVDPESLEEERRLCYVAITRASEQLFLSYFKYRYGHAINPSRFLWEMFER